MPRHAWVLTALVALFATVVVTASAGGTTKHSVAAQRRPNCTFRVEAFFWTGNAWMDLAQALAAERSPCAEYWISLPPQAGNKRALREQEDDEIRALGVHPVAEFTVGENTGWANWVNAPGTNRTWFDAGVEFRRAMERAGYDVTAGETWLINEFDRSTARDAAREPPDHPWPAARRNDMRDLMRGLYQGAPGMPKVEGIAEIGIHFRHQNIPDVDAYRQDLQAWLADSRFWVDADRYLRWLAVENYPDSRLWAPSGSSLQERASHLEAYIFHLLDLARSGPASAQTARTFFEGKFLPLVNAGWRSRGGEQFEFVTGHGNTIVDDVRMRQFVSEQVYAIRRYAGAHRHRAPAGRLGFSWQPCNRLSAAEPDCRPRDPAFSRSLDLISARIAEAIRFADGAGRTTAVGACASPNDTVDWCRGSLPGSAFTPAWDDFRWRPASARRSVDAVAYSPDGHVLAAASNAGPARPGIVRLWNPRTRKPAGRLVGHEGAVHDLAFGPDGRILATASADGTLRLWDLRARRQIGKPLRGHADAVWSVAFSRDGHTVASGSADGTVRLWNIGTHEQRGRPISVDYGYDVMFSSRDALFSASFSVQQWQARTHAQVGRPFCHARLGLNSTALTRDGGVMACASAVDPARGPSSLALWNVLTRRQVGGVLEGHTDEVLAVAFDADGGVFASGGGARDRTVRLWDVRTHKLIGTPLRGHTDSVASVAFSPDGRTLASGGWDGSLRLWSVRTHRQLGKPLRG